MRRALLFLLIAVLLTAGLSVSATEISSSDIGADGKTTSNVSVTYDASTANTGAQTAETWTVTVPATAEAGGQAQAVTASGSFSPARTLKVTAPETVMLYLDGDTAKDSVVLAVNFEDIALSGSYTEISSSAEKSFSVQEMSDIKFGIWTGTLEFSIEMTDTENYTPGNILGA